MSDRERWMVYPLLFLALGVSLRSKFTNSLSVGALECQTLTCRILSVEDQQAVARMRLGTVAHDGRLEIYGPQGKEVPVVSLGAESGSQAGYLMIKTAGGVPQVLLDTSPTGGRLRLVDSQGKVVIPLGFAPPRAGNPSPPPTDPGPNPTPQTPSQHPTTGEQPPGDATPPADNQPARPRGDEVDGVPLRPSTPRR